VEIQCTCNLLLILMICFLKSIEFSTLTSVNIILISCQCQIDPKWVKAFVHKARALQAQGKFDEVRFYLTSSCCELK